jgi:hypothetical protein
MSRSEHGWGAAQPLLLARGTHKEDGSWSAVPGMKTSLKKPSDTWLGKASDTGQPVRRGGHQGSHTCSPLRSALTILPLSTSPTKGLNTTWGGVSVSGALGREASATAVSLPDTQAHHAEGDGVQRRALQRVDGAALDVQYFVQSDA